MFECRLAESSDEIATLSTMLLREQNSAARSSRQAEWLREVMFVMMRSHWWYKLVPKEWVARRKLRTLSRRTLFDSDAYISRYPDVTQSGMDPLQHFIKHGMAEGRVGLPERYR
jgi:hypothetical protein